MTNEKEVKDLFVVGLISLQNDAGGSYGKQCSVVDDASLFVTQDFVIDKSTRVARTIA